MKPKILFLLHLPPPVHGASMTGAYIQQSNQINNSFTTTYFNIGTAISLSDIGKVGLKKYFAIIKQWVKIFIILTKDEYQLCYLTINAKGGAWYKELITVLLVRLFQIPLVFHYHNKGVASNAQTTLNDFLYRFQFKNSKTILLSPLLYNDIKRFVIPTNVFFIPNGVPDVARPFIQRNAISSPLTVNILFLSNLMAAKGVIILLKACAILKEKKIPFNCVFVGGESDITCLKFNEIVAAYSLTQHVFYKGKKYNEDKINIFLEADIFAFPTYYHNECFPLVLIEAMQYGLPIISTYEGGIPDMIEDSINGFLIPQQDVQALADKLAILINDADLRINMGNAGRKSYEKNYTLDLFENNLKNTFKKILF